MMRMKKKRWLKHQWRFLRCHWNRRMLGETTVVAVTGSCGKTTATYFLGKILGDCAPSYVGVDYNSRADVIKSMNRAQRTHRYLVHEVGVAEPGQMAGVLPLLKPDIGVVTTIGSDHYTNFRTLEATAYEKGGLIEALPASGMAVLNADDPNVLEMAKRSRAGVLTYGQSDAADVRATDILAAWPERLSMTVIFRGKHVRVETDLFGDLLVTSLLAAIAGALAAGVDLQQCGRSLASVSTFSGRMSIHRTRHGAWMINDSFKAPFWSVGRVVSLLENARAPRKTLVIGSFSDTAAGSDSKKYRQVAMQGLTLADRVVCVGKKSVHVRKLFSPELEGRLFAIDSVQEACRLLTEDVVADELILIKSSKLEHLGRLIFGQVDGFSCWKDICDKHSGCDQCKESGIKHEG